MLSVKGNKILIKIYYNQYLNYFRLKYICEFENVKIDDDAIDTLVDISGGDLRKSITLLQSMASSAIEIESSEDGGDIEYQKQISANDVREMSGYVPDEKVI